MIPQAALRATVQGDLGVGALVYSESFETSTGGWAGNTAFGMEDLPASVVQSTDTPDDGAYCLRTTWADGSDGKPQAILRDFSAETWWQVGQVFTMVARLRISNTDSIRANYIFHHVDNVMTNVVPGEWFTYAFTFTASTSGAYVGFENIAPTLGGYLDIDRVAIYVGTATDYPVPYHAGDSCPVLVDGADTAVTANGLPSYTPTPGDRLLVTKVGGQVEILQFLSAVTLTDGQPPSQSPPPQVSGGVANLAVSWSAVTNADPVTYEVHVKDSAFTAVQGDATTLAGTSVGGGVFYVYTLPRTGAALVQGTTYYVEIIALDGDGAAAPSAAVTGTLSSSSIIGQLTLAGDIPPPSNAPTVQQSVDYGLAYGTGTYPWAGLGDDGTYWMMARHNASSTAWEIDVCQIDKSTAAVSTRFTVSLSATNTSTLTSFHCDATQYAFVQNGGNGYYYVYFGTLAGTAGTSGYTGAGLTTAAYYDPAVFHDAVSNTYYVAAVAKSDAKVRVWQYDNLFASGTLVMTGQTSVGNSTDQRNLRGLYVGSADYGAQRFVVMSQDKTYVYSSAGAEQTAEGWSPDNPNAYNRGISWNGSNFYDNGEDNRIRKASPITAGWTLQATYTWFKSGAGTESTPSPAWTVTQMARRQILVSTDKIPSSSNPNAPDSVRIYVNLPTDSAPNRQTPDLAAGTTTLLVGSGGMPVASGVHAPTVDGFAGLGGGGSLVSEGLIDSTDALIDLSGDGSGRVGPLIWAADGSTTDPMTQRLDTGPWNTGTPPSGTSGIAFTVNHSGTYLLEADMTGYVTTGGAQTFYWYIDGSLAASRPFYFNAVSTHCAPIRMTWYQYLTKGTHYLWRRFPGASDSQDTGLFMFHRI